MVKFVLDGKEVEVSPGATILTAARAASIEIPTFCFQDRLSILASCRMCLVEIEGQGKLAPACATVAAENMVVRTRSPKVVTAREDMLEILLANHPLDCPICDKGGECELQDTVFEYGKGESRLHDPKRVFRTRDIELNNVIVFNANRCIQCQRCVRVCEEIVGDVALGTAERGLDAEITGVGNSLQDCSHCGNCIEICPVGALMSTPYRYKARPWDMVRADTICAMCGTGCSMTLQARDGELLRVKSKYETGINGELLCAKGRFGFDFIDGGERIRHPMIRKSGRLTEVGWDEAIAYIAKTSENIAAGGGRIAGLISPRQTNETAYMFQKLMRNVFRSPETHASCRFGGLEMAGRDGQAVLSRFLAHRYSRAPLQTLLNADCIFLLGSNISEENPVTGYLIRGALRDRKNRLILASSRPGGLDDIASATLRLLPGAEGELLSAVTAGHQMPDRGEVAGFVSRAKPVVAAAQSVTLLVGTEFLRTRAASDCLKWIEKAADLLEQDGKTVFVQFLFDRPNQLGLWDMGCLPDQTSDGTGADRAPTSGDAVPDMFFVLGADPVRSCPRGDPREVAAASTACLIVQDSHMSQTAQMATVVLPMPSYGEQSGTFTNNEGRVQKLRAIRPPAPGTLPVIDVFHQIAALRGVDLGADGAAQAFSEITTTIPIYQGLDDVAVENETALTGTRPRSDSPASAAPPDFAPSGVPENGHVLLTGDSRFSSGALCEHSDTLSSLGHGPYVEMNPAEGFEGDIDGCAVTLTRGEATFTARLKVNRSFAKGVVFVPENLLSGQAEKLLTFGDYPCRVEVNIQADFPLAEPKAALPGQPVAT